MRGSKGLPPDLAQRVRARVELEIANRFTRSDGTTWSQRAIAKELGITQPILSQILREGSGVGINAILALRVSLQMSVEEILGLEPLTGRATPADAERRRVAIKNAAAKQLKSNKK